MDTYLNKHADALKAHLNDGFEYVPRDQQMYQRYTAMLEKRKHRFGLVQVKSMMVHDALPVQFRIMDGDDEYHREEAMLFRSEYDRYHLLDPISATRPAESLPPDGYSAEEIEKWWNNRLFAPPSCALEAGIVDDGVGWDTLIPTSEKAEAGQVEKPHIQSVIEWACIGSGSEKIWLAEHCASSRILLIYHKIMYSKIHFPGTNPVSSVRKSARLLTVWSWVRSPHRVAPPFASFCTPIALSS